MYSDARQGGQGTITRAQRERAALDLIARRGPEVLRVARRHARDYDDAEDAYQRALELLLTKAPTTEPERLLPWLKAVVRNEAFALRRCREEPVEHQTLDRPDPGACLHEHAERRERLRRGAEAMRRLKPQEARALALRAEGLSYRQIAEATSWSYTKVDRCLKEGRRAFLGHLAAIESGAECDRLRPLLSRLADGEAGAAELVSIRPHVRGCPACRAVLREYRSAPARVAAIAPPAVVAGGSGDGLLARLGEAVTTFVGDRAGALALKAQSFGELVSAQKLAAVAASGAALAGGGVVAVERGGEPRAPRASASNDHADDGDAGQPGAVAPDRPRATWPPVPPSGPARPARRERPERSAREFSKPEASSSEFARSSASSGVSDGGEFSGSPEPAAAPAGDGDFSATPTPFQPAPSEFNRTEFGP